MKTRRPIALEPASFRVSTSPMRTSVENSDPSRTTDSAAVAPAFMAAETTSVAVSFRFIFPFSPSLEFDRDRLRHGDTEECVSQNQNLDPSTPALRTFARDDNSNSKAWSLDSQRALARDDSFDKSARIFCIMISRRWRGLGRIAFGNY